MIPIDLVHGLVGGLLIGSAAVLLMLCIGRIAGISGTMSSVIIPRDPANLPWRVAFLAGIPLGSLLASTLGLRDLGALVMPASIPMTLVAGLLVGIGTTYGSGCTSGHGICGLARLSPRSIAATVTFIGVAALTVFVIRHAS